MSVVVGIPRVIVPPYWGVPNLSHQLAVVVGAALVGGTEVVGLGVVAGVAEVAAGLEEVAVTAGEEVALVAHEVKTKDRIVTKTNTDQMNILLCFIITFIITLLLNKIPTTLRLGYYTIYSKNHFFPV